MVRRVGAAIAVIEAIYELDGDESAWLQRVVAALEPVMSGGMGLHAFTYDLATPPVRFRTSVERRPAVAPESVIGVLAGSEDALASGVRYDDLWRRSCFGSSAQAMSFDQHRALGIHDVLALNAFDTSGHGVFVGAPLARVRDVPAGEARLWMRVTAHLTAALRVRRLTGAVPVAVLTPTGRVEHVDDRARFAPREALRDAVARIEQARGTGLDDDASTRLWRPCVKDRYTLVDRFEADGRRYVVAYDSRPALALDALTTRELEVVAAIAGGQSSKQVAFALGISDATVRVLLARAAKRLGLARRDELIAFYRAHVE